MHKNSLHVEIPQYFEIDFLNLFTVGKGTQTSSSAEHFQRKLE